MMEPVVYRYKDFPSLLGAVKQGLFPIHGPVLTATRDLTRAWGYRFPGKEVYPVAAVLKSLLPWQTSGTRHAQYALLGVLLEGLKGVRAERIRVLQKNTAELVRSFREFVTDGVSPDTLPASLSLPEGVREAFAAFYAHPGSGVADFLDAVERCWKDGRLFRTELEQVVFHRKVRGEQQEHRPFAGADVVYLEGFYYITPLQARLFRALEEAGFQVVYLNNEDASVPLAYDIWHANPHFQGLSVRDVPGPSRRKRFAEGFKSGQAYGGVGFREFRDTFSFVRYLDRYKRDRLAGKPGAALYNPSGKEIRKMVDNFFSKDPRKTHLLAYPLGQYFMNLYSMWNPVRQQTEMTVEVFRKCLASGFAMDREARVADSREYLHAFECVSPYFEDCRTAPEWRTRVGELRELLAERGQPVSQDRWQTVLFDPYKTQGLYACGQENFSVIASLVDSTLSDAESLFGGETGVTDLYVHFQKLLAMIRRRESRQAVTAEERQVITTLEERLREHPVYFSRCSKNLLPGAMSMYLGGEEQLEDAEEDGDEETAADDSLYDKESGTIDPAGKPLVALLGQIEAAPVLAPERTIILAFCDASHMPGVSKPYPWPLNRAVVETLAAKAGGEVAGYLRDFLFVMENTVLANRYLFYLAMQNEKVEVTWVSRKKNGKLAVPTPYQAVFGIPASSSGDMLFGKPQQGMAGGTPGLLRPDGFASVYPRDYETFARNHPEAVKPFQGGGKAVGRVEPLEFTLDKSICPYRLAYDFVLQPYPCFTSRFLLSRLPAYLVAPEVRYLTHGRYLDPQRDPVDPAVEQAWSRVAHSFPFLNESEKAEQRYFGLFIDSGKFYSSSAAYKEGIPVSEMIHSGNYYPGEDENNRKRVQVLFTEYFGTEVYWSLVDMIHPTEDDDVGLLRKKNCQCCPHCETCFFRFNDDRPDKEDLDLPLIDLSRSVSAGSGENAEWPAPSAPFEPF